LGALGIHRFYLGYTGIGILMLLTGGVCGILLLIDFIRILFGDLGPNGGSYSDTF
jgi:TM2 domain-containing membrane protein YozV